MATREQVYRRFGPQMLEVIVLILMSELNIARSWTRDFKDEVAAATSLTDLKSRVASLPVLTERTPAQLIDAIEEKWAEVPMYDWMNPNP